MRPETESSSRTTCATVDVLVVGAGPAGLATALSAARHGARVLVAERRATTSTIPRATGVSTRTMEILRSWGLADAVRAGRIAAVPRVAVAATALAPPHEVAPLGFPDPREALAVSPVAAAVVPQDHLEPVLVDAVRAAGGRVRFGAEVSGLRPGPGGVGAQVGATPVQARFVVGADGPRSAVRAALGIGCTELGELGLFDQVLFRADLEELLPAGVHALTFVDRPHADGVLLPVGRGRWSFARTATGRAPDWPAVLRRAIGRDDLAVEILGTQQFTMAAALADRYRAGAGFVVGDAAHRMTPIGGRGMNTAIHDGHELGWRLGWVLRGLAGDALLDAWAAERETVGRANALRSLRRDAPDPHDGLPDDLGRTYASPVIAPDGHPPAAGHHRTARPGERAPHVWVRHRGRRASTLDVLADRLTLVTGTADAGWRTAARVAGVPMEVCGDGRELVGPRLRTAYRLAPGSAVLVRPDGIVAWRCDADPADPAAALRAAVATALGRRVAAAAA